MDWVPDWAERIVGGVFGAAGVMFFKVWLENRRLSKKEFRETLLERIAHLENRLDTLQDELAVALAKNARQEVIIENLQQERKEGEDHGGNSASRPESHR